ncbi:MAG: glucosamine-6-phosphate deaminase, partial [Phycisphaeraceae bacterium]|nr:glucosamine-6-phosphate deaminase [Phycisphaeraceae bacterium]
MTPHTLDHSAKTLERLPVTIFEDDSLASLEIADSIAELIIARQKSNETAVLGLATGASPIKVYRELVRKHKEDGLSFKNVVTFNLDEYYPMEKESILSYYYFMHHHLFDHVDIPKSNIHIPDGTIPIEKVKEYCDEYEKKIDAYGGLDIQILGIGRTGHVGFNEPPSFKDSQTRLVKLDPITISDATREFIREDLVPRRAITMGIKTIFKAKKIFLMAWGEKKASILKDAIEGNISEDIPASFLQDHPNTEVIIDENAALELTRFKTPWIVSLCEWNDSLAKRAVVWLSQKINKPILKLTEEDYKLNELGDLLVYYGSAQELNVKMFTAFQHTITGWPGGKPNTDDTFRPERSTPAKKRIIIFSPHPDDDVISMGGTFLRLVEQGHDVHVAYQTSGNIAVFDSDARRFADFAFDFMQSLGMDTSKYDASRNEVIEALKSKKRGEVDV